MCKDGFTFGDIHQLFHLQDDWGQGPRLVLGGDVALQLTLEHIQLISHIHEYAELNDDELRKQSKCSKVSSEFTLVFE